MHPRELRSEGTGDGLLRNVASAGIRTEERSIQSHCRAPARSAVLQGRNTADAFCAIRWNPDGTLCVSEPYVARG